MALEPIQCTSHSREIEQEYQKVVRGSDDDTTWLIISPDSQKEYGPSSTGSDFSEFIQSFDDGKVEYGIARVSPPGSDVGKIILIGWCPDSAPMKTRASFAANFGTVANDVLPGYHVQVTARDEDDLDEQDLLTKISNAAGARYSIQANGSSAASKAPASSSAPTKKVFTPSPAAKASVPPLVQAQKKFQDPMASKTPAPAPAPAASSNDDDWDEPEIKERDFQKEPLAANKSTYQPIGKIDLKKVIAEEQAKEDPRLVNKFDPKEDIAHLKHDAQVNRDQDLDNLLQQEKKVPGAVATKPPMVKSDFAKAPSDTGKVIQGFKTEKSPAQLWAEKKRLQNQQDDNDNDVETSKPEIVNSTPTQDAGVDDSEEMKIGDLKSRFEKLGAENQDDDTPVRPATVDVSNTTPKTFGQPAPGMSKEPVEEAKTPFVPSNIGQRLPGMHTEVSEHEDEDNNDDDWDDDEDNQASAPAAPRRNLPPPVAESRNVPPPPARAVVQDEEPEEEEEEAPAPSLPSRNAAPEPVQEDEQEEEEEAPAPSLPSRNSAPAPAEEEEEEAAAPSLPSRGAVPPPPQRAQEPEEEQTEAAGPWATAEYDYEAGEDNELTFSENDKIINIEFVDDDWWLGELEKSGERGLFPSNYVALSN